MSLPEIVQDRFEIVRHVAAPRARAWAAWADEATKRRWMDPSGTSRFDSDFRVGGAEVWEGRSPMGLHRNSTTYLEILPERLIAFAYSMALDGRVHSASVTTVAFEDDGQGTRVTFREQIQTLGPSDTAAMRAEGWAGMLGRIDAALAGAAPA